MNKFDSKKCQKAVDQSWEHQAAFLSVMLSVFSFPLWVAIDFIFLGGKGEGLKLYLGTVFIGIILMLFFERLSWSNCKNCHGKSKREYISGGDVYG